MTIHAVGCSMVTPDLPAMADVADGRAFVDHDLAQRFGCTLYWDKKAFEENIRFGSFAELRAW